MPPASTRHDHGAAGARTEPLSRREARLAELVAELSGCAEDRAIDAVRPHAEADDPLDAVARALTAIRREAEPQDRFRVAGFLRPHEQRLPRRTRTGRTTATRSVEAQLVHHGSLRRWDRTDADDTTSTTPHQGDAEVIDLRDRTDRFRRSDPGSHRA